MRHYGQSKLISILLVMLAILLSVAGCSRSKPAEKADKPEETSVYVDSFDFTGNSRKAAIAKKPKKIIVCGSNAADTLIAFGANDAIHTLILTEPDTIAAYKKLLPQADIYPVSISQEAVLEIKPDFILGMRRFFDNKVLGDTPFWENNGISAYIQDASGPIPSLGNFPRCTVESEKNFLRNMGKIFDNEPLAETEIRKIDEELQRVPSCTSAKPRVLFIEFMPNNIEAFGKELLSGDIVEKLGGEIISYKAPFIS
ncbi:MAG: hypothetical protein K6E80_00410, partial [Schwartzia sp.]|nr:hypothetical protein [Schwartzia sp. (in: firmicutes)]